MKRLLTLVVAAFIVLGCIAVMDISAGTSDQSGEATQYDYSLDLGTAQDVDVLNQNAEQTDPSADALEWYTPVGRTLTIDSVDELREFAYVVNSGIDDFEGRTVSLVKGVYDISGYEWKPIGITVEGSDGILVDYSFKGTFLGNGSTIAGLTLTADDTPCYSGMDGDYYAYGFFGGVVGGHVSDLVFTDFMIDAPGTSANNNTVAVAVGALVISGSVEDITVGQSGDDVIGHSRTAGVIGYVGGAKTTSALGGDDNVLGEFVIRGCVNYANVSAQWNTSSHGTAAGILATINAKDSTADGCLIIISDNTNYGDICGYYSAGIVASDFCKAEKAVSGNINEGSITTLVPADSAKESTSAAGIFLGQVSTGPSDNAGMTVEDNINNGSVTSSTGTASGIIGTMYNAEVYGNINNGDVTGYKAASGIVKVMYGGVVGGNANYGTVSVTVTAVDADDLDVYAGGIVGYVADSSFPDRHLNAELVGATYIESPNIVDGTVRGNTVYIGALAGCAVSGTVYGAESNHIGAIVVTGGTAKTLRLVDSQIGELRIKGGHNQSVIYTLELDGSSVGALKGISGAVHTGINLEIKGGEIGSFSLDFTGNDGTYTTINLLITGADIGELKVSAGTRDSPGYLNIAATDGGSVGIVDAECNVRLGTNVGDKPVANQDGICIVLSPETITLNSNASGTVAPAWAVYDGEWDEEKFGNGSTTSIGVYNAVSSEVFSGSISNAVSLRDDVSLFVMPGKTLTVSAEVTGTIVGMPGQSQLELQSNGLYGSLNAGTYVATEDGWESTDPKITVTVDDTEYVFGSFQEALLFDYPADAHVIIALGAGEYTYDFSSSSEGFSGNVLEIRGAGTDDAVIIIPGTSTFTHIGDHTGSSLAVSGVTFKSDDTADSSLNLWTFIDITFEDCKFDNVTVSRISGGNDQTLTGHFVMRSNVFKYSNGTITGGFAVTILTGSVEISDNTLSGYSRGFNISLNGSEHSVLIDGNNVSDLTSTSKGIAFQIGGDITDTDIVVRGNTVSDALYAVSIHDSSVETANSRLILLDNTLDGLTAHVFFAGDAAEQHVFIPVQASGNSFGDGLKMVTETGTPVEDVPVAVASETITVTGDVQISSAEDLISFAALVNSGVDFTGKTVSLNNGIDLSGYKWIPIGSPAHPFTGVFDGHGYTISGLSIEKVGTENIDLYVGLFGNILGAPNDEFAQVSDLYSDGSLNEGAISDGNYTAVVRNLILSDVNVRASGSFVAAVAGLAENALFCDVHVVNGTVVGTNSVGGIVGRGYSVVIDGCSAGSESTDTKVETYNDAKGSIYNIGGIAGALRAADSGYPSAVVFTENRADLSVKLTTGGAGGIVGHSNGSALLIYGCENRGDVTITEVGTVKYAYNAIAGGIVGLFQDNPDNTIVNSFNYGRISTADSVDNPAGALAGIANYYGGLVVGSGNYGEITGDAYYVAGIIGHGTTVTIEECFNEGAISLAEGNTVGYKSTICAGTTVATYKDMEFKDVGALLDALVKAAKKANTLTDSGATVHLVGVTVEDNTGILNLPEYLNVLTADESVCAGIEVGDRGVYDSEKLYNNIVLELGVPGAEVTVGDVHATDHEGQLTLSADDMSVTVNGQIGIIRLTAAVGMTVINNGTIGDVTAGDYDGPTDGTGITVYNGSEDDKTVQLGGVSSGVANMVFHNYGSLKDEALGNGDYLIRVGKANVYWQTNTFVLYNHSGAEIVGKRVNSSEQGGQNYLFYMPGGQSIVLNIMESSKLVNKTDSTSTWFMYYGLDGVNRTPESEYKGTLTISCASGTVFMGADGTTPTSITKSMWVGSDDGDAIGEFVSPLAVTFTGFPDGTVITVIDSAGGELVVDGNSISLAPGDYTAVGSLDGYVFEPKVFTVGSTAVSVNLEAALEEPTLEYEVELTADGATITLTATHVLDDVQFEYYAVSGGADTKLEANTMDVEKYGTYSFYVVASVGGYTAKSQTVDVEVDLPIAKVEVTFSPKNPVHGAEVTAHVSVTDSAPGVEITYWLNDGQTQDTTETEFDITFDGVGMQIVHVTLTSCGAFGVWEFPWVSEQVEVQVSFPESTGLPAQEFLADRGTILDPSDVEVEGYMVEGFLKDGQPYSGPLQDDPVVLTAVLSLDTPELTYTSVLTLDGIRVTLSASHLLDDAELACYMVTDGGSMPVEGGVFTTDVSGDYVFYAVASAGGMTSESERVTVTVSYVAPAVTVPVESAVGYAGGGSLALKASASDQVTLTYESSDPSVASVDGSGVVTMVSAGKATVSVIGELPSGEKLDPVTVSIEVLTAPAVEGVTFNPVTDATHEIVERVLPTVSEVPGSALEGGDVAVFDLTGTGERFTLSYADLGWSHITADNWERYDFYLVHIDEGYDIPSFTAGTDGITVQPDGFSPYVFISAEKSADPTPEPEPQPAAVTVSDIWIYAALAILLAECAAIMLLNRRRA